MDKFRLILILIVLAVTVAVTFFIFGNIRNIPFLFKQSTVTINNHTFTVEIAQTSAQKEKGLSGRNSLQTGHGMYFPFDTAGFYSFWMKDMKFSIDIIYIGNGKVVTVFNNLHPADDPYKTIVKPTQPINGVLEINAGEAQKNSIKEGDPVTISL